MTNQIDSQLLTTVLQLLTTECSSGFAEGLRRAGSRATRESFISGMEAIGETSLGGFQVALSASNHVASRYAELSMLTGDGKVRT